MRRYGLGLLGGLLVCGGAVGTARAADVPIMGLKLIVVDKTVAASTAKQGADTSRLLGDRLHAVRGW